tara:strand:+ start:76906 stop:78165 length:1260 start_codon:yes stop_codon:yes gene_type:complete
MKTIDELIAASEIEIGPFLTQMIIDGDVDNPIFGNYIFRQEPSNAAACLAAALGDIEILGELGFLRSGTSNQDNNYRIIKTLIEHHNENMLSMYENKHDFVPYIETSLSKADFHVLNYFVEKNPGEVMDALSHELIDKLFFLIEMKQVSVPENYEVLSTIMRTLMQYSREHVSEEQMLLWEAHTVRLGVGENAEADMPQALNYLTRLIPINCCGAESILDADVGILDNTKAYLIYLYVQKLVPEDRLSDDACMHLLHHIEVDKLSELSRGYLKATFQILLPSLITDSIFQNTEAEISTLLSHFKFYTLLTGGYPEEALSYFESIPEEVRSGEAWFHYGVALLEHVDGIPAHMIQDYLEKITSALQHAVAQGSEHAEDFLNQSFQKHDDGSISRIQAGVESSPDDERDDSLGSSFITRPK